MTLRSVPIEALEPHPENTNRMPRALLEKLKSHIARTGLYEPLIVRPIPTRNAERGMRNERQDNGANGKRIPVRNAERGMRNEQQDNSTSGKRCGAGHPQYQILNGHHRLQALRELGHTHARCDVWTVDDAEARMLLATLNRLEGRDDPEARGRLLARLAEGRSRQDLERLVPDRPEALERLVRLADPPPAPAAPQDLAPLPQAMTFFLTEEQHALVREALGEVARASEIRAQAPSPGIGIPGLAPAATPAGGIADRSCGRLTRAEALERIALWYLEARGRR